MEKDDDAPEDMDLMALLLPEGLDVVAIAASTGARRGDLRDRLVGDGLVPVGSALGRHPDPRRELGIPGAGEAQPGVEGSPGFLAMGAMEPRSTSQSGFQGPRGQTPPRPRSSSRAARPAPSTSGSLKSSRATQPNSSASWALMPR